MRCRADTSTQIHVEREDMTMITFGEKLRYLRRKNNLTQKQLGMAVGFPENTADVRIAQYESNARMPREELLKKLAQVLRVQKEILTVPVLTKPKEFSTAFFWMNEMGREKILFIIIKWIYSYSLI